MRELGAGAAEVLRRRPGKAVLVGNADDQTLASLADRRFPWWAFSFDRFVMLAEDSTPPPAEAQHEP